VHCAPCRPQLTFARKEAVVQSGNFALFLTRVGKTLRKWPTHWFSSAEVR